VRSGRGEDRLGQIKKCQDRTGRGGVGKVRTGRCISSEGYDNWSDSNSLKRRLGLWMTA
jgi:hypothetical protein